MNFQQPNTTTVPQTLLIRHWHNYFENGQTRRIKNLTYSLMPVDHNAIVRKTLLRKGGEGHRARTVLAELISIPTRRPQRVLVVDAQGPITAARSAPATEMSDSNVRAWMEHLAIKGLRWITYVACHRATPPVSTPGSVACHTESVAIQEKLTTTTRMFDPDVRTRLELIENKKLKWMSYVACHSSQPSPPTPDVVACHTQTLTLTQEPLTGQHLLQRPQVLWHATLNPLLFKRIVNDNRYQEARYAKRAPKTGILQETESSFTKTLILSSLPKALARKGNGLIEQAVKGFKNLANLKNVPSDAMEGGAPSMQGDSFRAKLTELLQASLPSVGKEGFSLPSP